LNKTTATIVLKIIVFLYYSFGIHQQLAMVKGHQQNLTAAPNGFFETLLLRHFYVFYLQIDKERVYLAV